MNQALYLLTIGVRESAFMNIKTIVECLADELINDAKGSSNNYAIKKKDEIEWVAKANHRSIHHFSVSTFSLWVGQDFGLVCFMFLRPVNFMLFGVGIQVLAICIKIILLSKLCLQWMACPSNNIENPKLR